MEATCGKPVQFRIQYLQKKTVVPCDLLAVFPSFMYNDIGLTQ